QLKAAYNAVVDIKNTLGFTWSDEHGGGILLKHNDVWDQYIHGMYFPHLSCHWLICK
ncbi:hypothetical protein PAXRUDRAFT_170619, partial [Paxillus rubicundulus Ve08.2h10]